MDWMKHWRQRSIERMKWKGLAPRETEGWLDHLQIVHFLMVVDRERKKKRDM